MLLRTNAKPIASASPCTVKSRPFRVLMIVESAGGGTGRHVLDLAEGLIQRGFEVHLIYSTSRADSLFLSRLAALPQIQRKALAMHTSMHPRDALVTHTVRRYLREAGPFDAVHGHSSKGGAIARLAVLGTNIPVYYTLHGLIMLDPLLPRWKWLLYLLIELVLSLRTRRVIAVSPEEARAAVRLRFGSSRVALIPNGLGPMQLVPRAAARQRLNLPADALAIGFVGRLVEQKAPEVLIHAFAETLAQIPQARLVMVGSGPLDPDLRRLAATKGLTDKIVWLGECDARQVLAAFDLFAIPSRKEGLPYVVLEAMAAGLPIVATTSAGVEILVTPGENGAVTPPEDADAFANAMIELLSDPLRLREFAQASRRRAGLFSIDVMVDRTIAVYGGRRAQMGLMHPITTGRVHSHECTPTAHPS
jgi:glycosyltransferase involved in cell wall biosynthesis